MTEGRAQGPLIRDDRTSWVTGDIFVADIAGVTLNAWEPWDWARAILFELQNSDIDDEHPEWRIQWIAGVALLRSIGHVLHNVDAKRSAIYRKSVSQFWSKTKSDKSGNWIFFEFIECERNNILKEFSFGAYLPLQEDDRILAYNGTHLDGAELFREAVYWWRAKLLALEASIRAEK